MNAPGLGDSRRAILAALKQSGGAAVPVLARIVGLNIETVREHLRALEARGLVERRGTRSEGPGRPTVVWGLTPEADALFPRREADVLRALAGFLEATGRKEILREFFDDYVRRLRAEALMRVEGLEGRERLEEAARILSEQGFMAFVEERNGVPELRLCHCPLRELVEVSTVPCQAEIGLVRHLVGETLTRIGHMPAGDTWCAYRGDAA
ncbi:MAG TPA: helix-turn-helix domain-containing protein [Longimicrobiales bacterium]|nr:helix-turn-helix domain-containing protein [Longimicrobiales bacterium]